MFVSAIILCSFLLHCVHYDVVISSIVVLNTLPCSLTSLSVLSFSLLLHHVFFSLRLFIIYTAPCETDHTYKTLETQGASRIGSSKDDEIVLLFSWSLFANAHTPLSNGNIRMAVRRVACRKKSRVNLEFNIGGHKRGCTKALADAIESTDGFYLKGISRRHCWERLIFKSFNQQGSVTCRCYLFPRYVLLVTRRIFLTC